MSLKTVIPMTVVTALAATSFATEFTYEAAGRRDPFVSPRHAPGGGPDVTQPRPGGLAGMLIHEMKFDGVSMAGNDAIALLTGTDDLGYFVRAGDELWDGKVADIDFDRERIVFQQRVEDPNAQERFRDVEVMLYPTRTR